MERFKKHLPLLLSIFAVAILVALAVFSAIKHHQPTTSEEPVPAQSETAEAEETAEIAEEPVGPDEIELLKSAPIPTGGNCTTNLKRLMLINPNFKVDTTFIANRRSELISLYSTYGIAEGHSWNGDNLIDQEAAEHLNDMVKAYEAYNQGHTMVTNSCFRAAGMPCGRLCAATGESDHHTGYTCDLIDPSYGEDLDTTQYANHPEWQWLRENSYKFGFIDRFPEAWAGGTMDEPFNVDNNGTTGLFETWHYRYVGIKEATEIATGKYNNGAYDSLEHYLKTRGFVNSLNPASCD